MMVRWLYFLECVHVLNVTGLLIFTIFGMVSAAKIPGGSRQRPGRPFVPVPPLDQGIGQRTTFTITVIGVINFDRHYCIFRGGMGQVTGPADLQIGDTAEFDIEQGTATLRTGRSVTVEDGIIHVRILHPRNTAAIKRALSRAGMTLAEFNQQVGTPLPDSGVIEVTAGELSFGGTYRRIKAGVLILVSDASQGNIYTPPKNIYTPPENIYTPPTIYGAPPQDSLYGSPITETAPPVTVTNYQDFTLTKTSTYNNFVTITSPVYNRAEVTNTNFVRKTSVLYEEEVIRSPLPGSITVNTVTIYYTTYITVTDTATNFFVETILDTVTSTLQHISSHFSFRTVTSNQIYTTSVIQTISRTSIATIYTTNTVGKPVYITTYTTITITGSPSYERPNPYGN